MAIPCLDPSWLDSLDEIFMPALPLVERLNSLNWQHQPQQQNYTQQQKPLLVQRYINSSLDETGCTVATSPQFSSPSSDISPHSGGKTNWPTTASGEDTETGRQSFMTASAQNQLVSQLAAMPLLLSQNNQLMTIPSPSASLATSPSSTLSSPSAAAAGICLPYLNQVIGTSLHQPSSAVQLATLLCCNANDTATSQQPQVPIVVLLLPASGSAEVVTSRLNATVNNAMAASTTNVMSINPGVQPAIAAAALRNETPGNGGSCTIVSGKSTDRVVSQTAKSVQAVVADNSRRRCCSQITSPPDVSCTTPIGGGLSFDAENNEVDLEDIESVLGCTDLSVTTLAGLPGMYNETEKSKKFKSTPAELLSTQFVDNIDDVDDVDVTSLLDNGDETFQTHRQVNSVLRRLDADLSSGVRHRPPDLSVFLTPNSNKGSIDGGNRLCLDDIVDLTATESMDELLRACIADVTDNKTTAAKILSDPATPTLSSDDSQANKADDDDDAECPAVWNRQLRRREQNRRAARNSRERRKAHAISVIRAYRQQNSLFTALNYEIARLKRHQKVLNKILGEHVNSTTGTCMLDNNRVESTSGCT